MLFFFFLLCNGKGYSKLFEDIWAKIVAETNFESVYKPIDFKADSSLIKLLNI